MTFQDLVENLGLSAGGLRVLFCQKKWSIHSPEDVRKFLATRFSGQKRRRKTRLPEAANHLRKWRFVKKVRRAENMEHETHNLEQNENEKMAAEKITRLKNENSAAAEKLKIAEEKLAEKETLIAAKERKIAVLMRQNSELKIQTRSEQKPLPRELTEKDEVKISEVVEETSPTPLPFGHLPH